MGVKRYQTKMSHHAAYLPYMTNSLAIRQEIQRFESVHPSIYAIYDLIELVPDPLLAQQIREHVVCIEGKSDQLISLIYVTGYFRHMRVLSLEVYIDNFVSYLCSGVARKIRPIKCLHKIVEWPRKIG